MTSMEGGSVQGGIKDVYIPSFLRWNRLRVDGTEIHGCTPTRRKGDSPASKGIGSVLPMCIVPFLTCVPAMKTSGLDPSCVVIDLYNT